MSRKRGLTEGSTANALQEHATKIIDQAGPTARKVASDARDWAAPTLTKYGNKGLEVAAPRIGQAAVALAPVVEAARNKIVDDFLPKVVEATEHAADRAASHANATAASSESALMGLSATSKKVIKEAKKESKRATRKQAKAQAKLDRHRSKIAKQAERDAAKAAKIAARENAPKRKGRKTFVTLVVIGAAGAAAYYAWKKSQPKDDPWVTATGSAQMASSFPTPRDVAEGNTPAGSPLGTYVPPRAVDLTEDADHALGGMSEETPNEKPRSNN